MITPALHGEALLDDIRSAQDITDQLHLWWLGQSGFLIQYDGRHLLLDPYLSDSLTSKYADTDKPHVRMTELAILPQQLDFIDVVTSSHNHTDHLDRETLVPLMNVNPGLIVVVPAANRTFAADRLQVNPDRLTPIDCGERFEASIFSIRAVAAAHETIERDEQGHTKYLGYVVQVGARSIYHSGDTMLFDGMVDTLSSLDIDVAILPINGRAAERRVAGNLNAIEAARLARDIGAKVAIPCHYEMFEFNTADPKMFAAECETIGQGHRVLKCGQRWSYSAR